MKTLACMLVLLVAACDKRKEVAAGSDVGSAAGSDTGSAGSAAVAEAPVEIPTEMDYEDLANEEITDKTVEARLEDLETQLAPQ
jgi:hypothetical protein